MLLDATTPGSCGLADVLTGGDRLSYPDQPALVSGGLEPSLPTPRLRWCLPRLCFARLGSGEALTEAAVRAEVLDAHAVAIIVGYRDVVADQGGKAAAAVAERVGPWLALAVEVAHPDLITVVVDGVEASNSSPGSRLSWTRQKVRRRLPLPAWWEASAIVETSSLNARRALSDVRSGQAPPSLAAHSWTADGIAALLDRGIMPFERDPVRWLTETALRRARFAFGRAGEALADILAARPAGALVDEASALDPGYARHRRAWLAAQGVAEILRPADDALAGAIAQVAAQAGAPG